MAMEFDVTEEQLANLKASLGISPDEEPKVDAAPVITEPPPVIKRRRGRPRKNPLPEGATPVVSTEPKMTLADIAPKLSKRDEKEVADRLGNILMGATGMGVLVKPYLPMTEEEANAIAVPLASYLVRNADLSPVAREILENYDLVAMTLGVSSYALRVYHDRREELATQRPSNVTLAQRVSPSQGAGDGRGSDEGDGAKLSVAYGESSQPYTPNL